MGLSHIAQLGRARLRRARRRFNREGDRLADAPTVTCRPCSPTTPACSNSRALRCHGGATAGGDWTTMPIHANLPK
eukprot:578078-Pyramimonas_sp.AAC.1